MDHLTEAYLQSGEAPLKHSLQKLAEKSVTDVDFSEVAFNLQSIFLFCLVTYGSIGALWLSLTKMTDLNIRFPLVQIVLLCLTWASMSIGMHVLNKTLVVALRAPSLITSFQMLMSCLAMLATSSTELFKANRRELLIWMVVPGLFAGMLISSFYTYEFISLSLLTVVRNLAPLVVLPIESMIMPAGKGPQISSMVVVSIMTMLGGAIIYGGSLGVGEISWIGIMFAVLNMALACSDRMIQRRLLSTDCSSLTLETCTIVTNFFGMLPTLALAYGTREISGAMNMSPGAANQWTDPRILALLFISGGIGLGICYFGFAVTREISATSFMVLQNTSKIMVVALGVTFFQDPVKSPYMVLGLALSIGGSFMYGKAQMDIAQQDKLEKQKLLESNSEPEKSA